MRNTVLLVIDMQVDFFDHDRLKARRGELVARTNELVSYMRKAGVPVIWVRQEFAADLTDAPLDVKRNGFRVTVAGTPGAAFLPELEVGDDAVITKKRYSAFFGTSLDETLRSYRCERVIVAGVNTHACIRTTVVDAYQRDYDVILASDCIDSADAEHHDVSLRYMEGKLATSVGNPDILRFIA
jgi:nicotinamidase-related amidase